ncbi:MAG: ferredoxin family protein [Candidatus Odinarchaeota archaeon]|nr:4Fe-4S binding protein [Candidatus Thorarchaeota archaeon]
MTLVLEKSKLDISYNPSNCNRCGMCIEVCPFNVWDFPDHGPAVLARPQDCTNCTACAQNCLGYAISVLNIGCGCIWNESARRRGQQQDKLIGPDSETDSCCTGSSSCCG